MESGADVQVSKKRGGTILHTAVNTGRVEMARRLIERKADLEARDERDLTPLQYAVGKDEAMMRLLLESGANVEARCTEYGFTLL